MLDISGRLAVETVHKGVRDDADLTGGHSES
jgi:hypothetical protein